VKTVKEDTLWVIAVGNRLRHLRSALAVVAFALVVGIVLGWLWRQGTGAAGAAAGIGLVALSYVVSSVILAWADLVNPRLIMPVGLATYGVKFTVMGILMAAVSRAGWAGLPAMGVGIIATALAWTGAQAWWVWRAGSYVKPLVDAGRR